MASFLYTEVEAHTLLKQLVEKYVLKQESISPYTAILEVGAGSGNLLQGLVTQYNVKGCGTDPFMSERTEGRARFLPLKAEEIEQLTRRYNLIYTVHSLHHFSNPQKFFDSASKKLTWSGKIIIVDWNRGAKTGIPEHYYDIERVDKWAKSSNLRLIESGINGQNFFAILELRKKMVAVASEDGINVFRGMFGQPPYFFIYTYDETYSQRGNHENTQTTNINKKDRSHPFKLSRMVKNQYSNTLQHLKTYDVYNEVAECQAIIARSIGKKGQQRLKELGIEVILNPPEKIEEALRFLVNFQTR